ncbi:MAG: WD-repeat protein [Armatimonadetes bacterium]|nr:WD-repeat protein [Armatimonadota bacterium]
MSTEGADFYITGGTLRADAPSYVERAADRELYDALSRSDCCYVLTSRQMGKSSLMVRTAFRLRAEGVRVAVLDLTAIGLNLTPDQWYGGLLRRMARQLDPRRGLEDRVDDYWTEHPELSPLQRFTDALEHVVLPYASATPAPADAPARPALVIFIDEIDVVLSLPFNTDELFAAIRAFYNRRDENPDLRRLTFCFLGVATPSDLIREARMTPFNIGVRVELCDFTPAEALPLRHGLSADPRKGEALLKRVLHWTGGHPYLTQRLCRSFSVEPAGETSDAVDAVCGKLFLAAGAQDRDDNLLFVRERMLHGTDDPAALLTMLMQVRRGARIPARNTDPVVEQLLLSGVVRASRARLEVRNRIYHHVFAPQWITEHMPDAEVRRQRAAYRRGLVRATAFAGSITLVVAALGLYAWDQAGRAERYAQARTQESERAAAESRRATRSEANSKQQTFRANRERSAAVKARAAAVRLAAARERALKYAHGQQLVAEAATGRALGAEQTARNEAATTRRLLYAANAHLLQREWEAGNFARVHQLLADSRDHPDRGFEWAFWERKSHPEEALLVGHTDAVTAAGYSRDGRLLTGSADGSVRLWSPSGSSRLLLTQFVSVTAAAFSPDGSRIVTGGGDGGVRIWDARTGRLLALLPGHTGIVNAIDWSPDGSRLLSASEDASVRIWNRTGGEYRRILSVGNPVRAAVWSRDGRRIVTGTAEGGLAVWNAETGQRLAASPLSPRALGSMVVSASGRTVAAAGAEGVIYLWDLDKQEVLRRMKGHSAAVTSATWTAWPAGGEWRPRRASRYWSGTAACAASRSHRMGRYWRRPALTVAWGSGTPGVPPSSGGSAATTGALPRSPSTGRGPVCLAPGPTRWPGSGASRTEAPWATWRDIRATLTRRSSPRTAFGASPQAGTGPRACGTSGRSTREAPYPRTESRYARLDSRQTANEW